MANSDKDDVNDAKATKTIGKPFDPDFGGDCIIKTVDNAIFHVHRNILALASSVFANMFSLPHPSTASETQTTPPVLDVAEDSVVIDFLLRSIYPLPKPVVDSWDLASSLVLAIEKYLISPELLSLRLFLSSDETISAGPIRTYAMAWRLRFRDEASKASGYTHTLDLSDKDIKRQLFEGTGGFEALIALHELRSKRAAHLNSVFKPLSTSYLVCDRCSQDTIQVYEQSQNLLAALKDALDRPQNFPQGLLTFWKLREVLYRRCTICSSRSENMPFPLDRVTHFWAKVQAHPSTIEWPEDT